MTITKTIKAWTLTDSATIAMMMPAVVAPMLGIRSRIPAITRKGERVR